MESREQLLLAIKQEIDTMANAHHNPVENETSNDKDEPQNSHMENPFENVQLHIKQENSKPEISNSEMLTSNSRIITLKTETEIAQTVETNEGIIVKEEVQNDSVVSFNSPNFDDSMSMDSDDATALGNVEACLQEELNIKFEIEGCEVSKYF